MFNPFRDLLIVLADYNFRDKGGIPENMKICKKGTWSERMCIETALSLVTIVCDLPVLADCPGKRIRHRLVVYIQTRLSYVSAMFNVLLYLFQSIHPDADPYKMSIADFSL